MLVLCIHVNAFAVADPRFPLGGGPQPFRSVTNVRHTAPHLDPLMNLSMRVDPGVLPPSGIQFLYFGVFSPQKSPSRKYMLKLAHRSLLVVDTNKAQKRINNWIDHCLTDGLSKVGVSWCLSFVSRSVWAFIVSRICTDRVI